MKKICSLLILIFVFSFMVNVKADMGPPVVIKYYVTVVNKSGAACYEENAQNTYVKTKKSIPYGTTLYVVEEAINSKYIRAYSDSPDVEDCTIALADTMIKNSNFDIKSEGVEKIDPIKAVIFADGGLNLRKGPAMSYGRIITVPQHAVVTLSYKAGSYWYYAEYNGQKGWISGINGYFGYDGNDVLYDYVDTEIYNDKGKVIDTIPKFTEITDYVNIVERGSFKKYYVNYNGVKGYVSNMPSKVDGELKVNGDAYVYEGSKVIGKVNNGETVKYNVLKTGLYADPDEIYCPSLKGILKLKNILDGKQEYTIVKENPVKKLKGYIGEGLFGEKKEENKQDPITDVDPPVVDDNEKEKTNNQGMDYTIIIICILCSIIGALTCFIIIKLVNMKKEKKGDAVNESEKKQDNI